MRRVFVAWYYIAWDFDLVYEDLRDTPHLMLLHFIPSLLFFQYLSISTSFLFFPHLAIACTINANVLHSILHLKCQLFISNKLLGVNSPYSLFLDALTLCSDLCDIHLCLYV